MRKINYFLILVLFLPLIANAQEEEKKFGIEFSGFVKNDFFFDTRQTVNAREGHFLLWPTPVNIDALGNDIDAQPNFNFLAVQSRLSGKITGPDAFGAKTSALIEGDFFGQLDPNINLFRLRHAFIKFNWGTTELLTGQTWNPLFVTSVFPATVSFNTGTPLQSFARNPQVRLTQGFGNLKVIAAALAQRDYSNRYLKNLPSSDYLRNSAIPDLHLQVHYELKNEETGTGFLIGVGGEYKTIVPRLSSEMTISPEYFDLVNIDSIVKINAVKVRYKVDESLSSMAAIAFGKITLIPLTLKLQGRYGENIPDVLSISGFAVKQVVDTITGEQSYTPLQNITVWGEIHTNGKKIQVGIFGGYLQNLGTKETMSLATNPVYGFGTNIKSLYRISPRVIFNSGKARFAAEIEHTAATFGSEFDVNYQPTKTSTTSNTRFLLSDIYFF